MLSSFFPSCVVEYCRAFGIYNLHTGNIGDLLLRSILSPTDFIPMREYKFLLLDFSSTSFLYNAADSVSYWLLLLSVIPLLLLARFAFRAYPYVVQMEIRYRLSVPFLAIVVPYLKLFIASTLNLKHVSVFWSYSLDRFL